jgi:hypothetical protein
MTNLLSKFRWGGLALVGALILGSGVAAAVTATGGDGSVSTTDTTVSSGPTDGTSATTLPKDNTVPSTTATTTPSGTDQAGTTTATVSGSRYWDADCGDTPMNHGQYVASQVHSGAVPSVAAHSPCGMPTSAVGDGPTTGNDTEAPEPPATESDTDGGTGGSSSSNRPAAPPGHSSSQGNGRGASH